RLVPHGRRRRARRHGPPPRRRPPEGRLRLRRLQRLPRRDRGAAPRARGDRAGRRRRRPRPAPRRGRPRLRGPRRRPPQRRARGPRLGSRQHGQLQGPAPRARRRGAAAERQRQGAQGPLARAGLRRGGERPRVRVAERRRSHALRRHCLPMIANGVNGGSVIVVCAWAPSSAAVSASLVDPTECAEVDLEPGASCAFTVGVYAGNEEFDRGTIAFSASTSSLTDSVFTQLVDVTDPVPAADRDGDGVPDAEDDCVDTPNPSQLDSDGDGFGNACDADYDNDGVVGAADWIQLSQAFGSTVGGPHYSTVLDADGDGAIGGVDLLWLAQSFGKAPGPSGLSCAGTVPCP